MSNHKSLEDFQKFYCSTLISEENSNSFYVKLHVADYNEVNVIRGNLLTAIHLIARYNETSQYPDRSEVTHSILTLVELAHKLDLTEEMDGLSSLMNV